MSQEVSADHAFEVEARIRTTVHRLQQDWIALAVDLYEFQDAKLWKDLGHVSFEEWLASPDIDLDRRTVYGLIQLYREYVILRNVEPERLERVQVSKAQDVLPAVRREDVTVEEALSDAESLSRTDIREKYYSPNGRKPDAKLEATEEESFERCPACGQRMPNGSA